MNVFETIVEYNVQYCTFMYSTVMHVSFQILREVVRDSTISVRYEQYWVNLAQAIQWVSHTDVAVVPCHSYE